MQLIALPYHHTYLFVDTTLCVLCPTGQESAPTRSRSDSRLSDIPTDSTRGRSNSGAAGFSLALLEGYPDSSAAVGVSGKRHSSKYRSRESIERAKELYADAVTSVDNLGTACEGQMEVAVVGVLTSIAGILENSGERQRAFYRANVAPILVQTLIDMMQYVSVCERALQVMALLCRHSDDVKTSSSLENAKVGSLYIYFFYLLLSLLVFCPVSIAHTMCSLYFPIHTYLPRT